jgi:hypothetical protein
MRSIALDSRNLAGFVAAHKLKTILLHRV